eukprot:jgi/Chrzof1/14530/Cz09g06070.t1
MQDSDGAVCDKHSNKLEALLSELRKLKLRIAEVEEQLVALDGGWSDARKRSFDCGSELLTRQDSLVEHPSAGVSLQPDAVTMDATRIVMNQIVMPAECDGLGICFGGQVLSWIDICAGLSAKTLARGPCVTVSVDAVYFLRPCRLGTVVIIAAMVNRTFSSSMEVGVRVEAEDMKTGVRRHCCSAYLTFVSLRSKETSQHGRSSPALPRVMPNTPEHKRIFDQAAGRRNERLAVRQHLRDHPAEAEAEAACRLRPITHREGCPTLSPALTLLPGASAGRRKVAPGATIAYMTQSIMPHHANTLGITFGGQVMSWMEQCAYISASRLRGTHLLTAGMDSVAFAKPTHVGDILYVTAQVTAIFETSLEVMISVFGETPKTGQSFHCADAYATVVVVDGSGNPMSIPFELQPSTDTEKLRYEGALRRREDRLAMRSALTAQTASRPSLDGLLYDEQDDYQGAIGI